MPRYHVRVITPTGTPILYLAQRHHDGHDGAYTDTYSSRIVWRTPQGAKRKIEIERMRLPNKWYGDLQFEVVEEPGPCSHCGKALYGEPSPLGKHRWVDIEGSDVCVLGEGTGRHEPT